MADFRLPAIEPVGPVTSAAGAIDRAGAQFKNAADAVGQVMLDADMAELAVQMQEATLQTTKKVTDTLQFIKSTDYVTPEQAKALLGGEDPNVRWTDDVVESPGAPPVKRPRQVIATHELIPQLVERETSLATENAAGVIKSPGWQKAWKLSAAKDMERVRAEALDWQRTQRLADVRVQSRAQIQQAAAAGNWPLYEQILNTPENQMDPGERKLWWARLPGLKTETMLKDGIRVARTPEDLDELAGLVEANKVEKGGLQAALTDDEQAQYLKAIQVRKDVLAQEAEKAKAAPFDAQAQKLDNMSVEERQKWFSENPTWKVPDNFTNPESYQYRKAWYDRLTSTKALEDNDRLYLRIQNNRDWFRGLSEDTVGVMLAANFAPERRRELARLYADLKEGKAPSQPALTSREIDHVKEAARLSLGIERGAPVPVEQEKALLLAEDQIEMQMLARKRLKPDEPITFGVAYESRSRQTAVNTTAEKGLLITRPMTDPERQKFYNLDDPATAEAWRWLWARTHNGAPVTSNSELYDMIDNATKEWGADVERAWAINPLEKTPHLTATVIARLADRHHVETTIDPLLPADSKSDPKVLRRRRALAAVQLSTPSGAEGVQAKIAEQEAAVVRQEQLTEGVARRAVSSRAALTDKAMWYAMRDMPSGPKTYDWWTGKMPAEAQGAARAVWESDMSKRRIMAETAVEQYEQYLSRNDVDPSQPDVEVRARAKSLLGFGEFFARFEKGVAP